MTEASINLTIGKLAIQGMVGTNESSSSGSKSWLVAIAQALGAMLGEKAEKMKGLVDKMNAVSGEPLLDPVAVDKVVRARDAPEPVF